MSVCFISEALQADPEMEANFESSQSPHVGETCRLTIRVSWRSEEADYYFPEPQISLEQFALEDRGEANETFQKEGQAWKRKIFHFDLRAAQQGKGRIGAVRLNYIDPLRGEGGHFEIPAREFQIRPGRRGLSQGFVLALGLGAVGGLFGSWVWWRHSKAKRAVGHSLEPTLEDRYLSHLNQLKKMEGSPEREPNAVSEWGKLLRSYLSEKYSLPSAGLTGQETMSQMKEKVSQEEWNFLKKIFDQLEEAGYSDPNQSPKEGKTLRMEILRYVEGKRVIAL